MRLASVLAGLVLASAISLSFACSLRENPGAPTDSSITVTGVTPSPARVGTTLTITGRGFAATGNAVKIGGGYVGTFDSPDGKIITFQLPGYMGVCSPFWDGPCVTLALLVTPGEHEISVLTKSAASNSVRLVVDKS